VELADAAGQLGEDLAGDGPVVGEDGGEALRAEDERLHLGLGLDRGSSRRRIEQCHLAEVRPRAQLSQALAALDDLGPTLGYQEERRGPAAFGDDVLTGRVRLLTSVS